MKSHRFRLLAPAGAPVPGGAILPSAVPLLRGREYLAEVIKEHLNMKHCFLLSSGRAALTVLLRAFQQLSDRREVVIPGYTCFSVPSAVVRAGLAVRLCDVDPKTLDFDQNELAQIALDKVLCLVPSSLYGMPSDLRTLDKLSIEAGTFLADDAAQCLGATLEGKSCGTFGDAGIYSLGRGKNISAMGGGILITQREDLANLIRNDVNNLSRPSPLNVLSSALNSLAYFAMLPPSSYWLLDHIPYLGLGLSVFDPNFAMMHLSSYQKRLASRLLMFVEPYNRMRQENARHLQDGIKEIEGVEIPQPSKGANPVYLRFPILARDEKHRDRLLRGLKNAGIGATASYPSAIGDIPEIQGYLAVDQKDCPGAQSLAERIITLPTHPYVTSTDVEKMVEIIRSQQ